MKCSKRKQIIKEKRNQLKERQNMSYACVTQTTPPATMPSYTTPLVTKEEILKIHLCVVHAQNKDQKNPGTYKAELNKVLKANKLPTIIIPDEPEDNNESSRTETVKGAMATEQSKPEPKERRRLSRENST